MIQMFLIIIIINKKKSLQKWHHIKGTLAWESFTKEWHELISSTQIGLVWEIVNPIYGSVIHEIISSY